MTTKLLIGLICLSLASCSNFTVNYTSPRTGIKYTLFVQPPINVEGGK